jgi:AraC-like DNA-binding protein
VNLLSRPGVTVEPRFSHTLVEPPEGLAALCQPHPQDVGYQYRSTWQGPDTPCGQDWYVCRFPERVKVNTVGFAHGPLFIDGGWWQSFDVEWLDRDDHWRTVTNRRVTPSYDFSNTFWEQPAYQPYAVFFDPVETSAIRLVGEAGGLDSYVSLAWLGVFLEDDPLEPPGWLTRLPPPRLFQLLEPARLWDFLRDFQVITNLGVFAVPKAYKASDWPGVEQYLDRTRRREYAQAVEQYFAADGFLSMVTARTAGDSVFANARQTALLTSQTNTPHLIVHAGNLAHLFAPVVVSDEVLGTLQTWSAVFCDQADLDWHRQWAGELDGRGIVSKDDYLRALAAVPVMSRGQLEACLRMLHLISGQIANLAEQNMRQAQRIEEMRQSIDQLRSWRQQVAQQAIAYMQANFAEPIRLQDIARHVMLSPSYFSQIFREETGRSPIDYLIDHRMEHAKRLLCTGRVNVTEAAGAVGYDSVSYFIRQFAARVGVTPGQWIRRERPKPDGL